MIFEIGIGVLLALMYMTLGLGVARIIAKMKGRDMQFIELLLWPLALLVIAIAGDIA